MDHREPLVSLKPLCKVNALEQLHHKVERTINGGTAVGDLDDVGVSDSRGGPRLHPEAGNHLGCSRVDRVEDLDGDLSANFGVFSLEHSAHSAFADFAQNFPSLDDGAEHLPGVVRREILHHLTRDFPFAQLALVSGRRRLDLFEDICPSLRLLLRRLSLVLRLFLDRLQPLVDVFD